MCIILVLRSMAVIQLAVALRILPPERKINESHNVPSLPKIKDTVFKPSNYMNDRRSATNEKQFDSAKVLLESFKQNLQKRDKHQHSNVKFLRLNQEATTDTLKGEELVRALRDENELKGIAADASALLERPYVQHRGKYDFLVMKTEHLDKFVTVVPNNIYYNVEKPCVNWLDSCSLQGIRAHLLQKVRSPYK